SSRRRHTRSKRDWSSDVCSSDLEKSSAAIINAMKEKDISYCYIDDFCSSNLEAIQSEALLMEMRSYFKEHSFSIQEILQTAINNTRVTMSKQELEEFKKRYLSKIKISIENDIIQVDI